MAFEHREPHLYGINNVLFAWYWASQTSGYIFKCPHCSVGRNCFWGDTTVKLDGSSIPEKGLKNSSRKKTCSDDMPGVNLLTETTFRTAATDFGSIMSSFLHLFQNAFIQKCSKVNLHSLLNSKFEFCSNMDRGAVGLAAPQRVYSFCSLLCFCVLNFCCIGFKMSQFNLGGLLDLIWKRNVYSFLIDIDVARRTQVDELPD